MISRSEALFHLVKSLSQNEKGYYIKFVAQQSKKDARHLVLFRELDSMETYDAKILQYKLSLKGFPEKSHRVAQYLYDSVLNSLEQYHRGNTPTDQVFILLRRAYVLSDRKLHLQSNELLEKAEKLCYHGGKDSLLFEVLKLQNNNNIASSLSRGRILDTELLDRQFLAAQTHLKKVTLGRAYTNLSKLYHSKGSALNEKEVKEYEKLAASLLTGVSDDENDPWIKLGWHEVHFVLGQLINNKKLSQNSLEGAYQILKAHLNILEVKQTLSAIAYNLINYYLEDRDFQRVESELDSLEAWLQENEGALSVFHHDDFMFKINLHRLNLFLCDHPRRRNEKALQDVLTFFTEQGSDITKTFIFQFKMASLHVYQNRYKEALIYINELLNDKTYRNDDAPLYAELEILNIITHFKLGHMDLIDHLINNLKRKLSSGTYTANAKFLRCILDSIGKAGLQQSSDDWLRWKEGLLIELRSHFQKTGRGDLSMEFDYSWYFENVF